MSVHVDELHTDVRLASAAAQGAGSDARTESSDEAGESFQEAWRRAMCLARRIAAVDFDD